MDYEIKLVNFDSEESLQPIIDLQNIVYTGHSFSSEGFKFWYIDNPMGKVISFNAFYGDALVAHYACVPVKMRIEDRVVNGLLDMATVTHPDHRGKGLFKTLAKTTYEYAAKHGFEYVVGVANANSFPGYMKYFNFTFVAQLDVKWGWGTNIYKTSKKTFSGYWDEESLNWRLGRKKYSLYKNIAVGRYGNHIGIKTFMGGFDDDLFRKLKVNKSCNLLRPVNLYIGLGADLSKGHYFNVPKFIKHSPFNLIFLDLTDGKLPKVNKDNMFFQLIDFDVA